jgi:uncharacterized membrane-anchored protein YjiN (DUF445 family)
MVRDGRHQEFLDKTLNVLHATLRKNEDFIRRRIGEESPWWVPELAEERLHDKVVGAIERTLGAIVADPNHALRDQFNTAVMDFIERLKTAPRTIERAEEIKEELLASPVILNLSAKLWGDVRDTLRRYADDPSGEPPPELERAIQSFGQRLLADDALRARMDRAVAGAVAGLAEQHRSHVGDLIVETVNRWDGAETARRLELQVGRDLQYGRINGTLVGSLVGLALDALRRFL